MRTSHRVLALAASTLLACSSSSSSSSSSSAPSKQSVYFALHLTSVQDPAGQEQVSHFQDLSTSHLYLKLDISTAASGTKTVTPSVVDINGNDLEASIDTSSAIITLGTAPLAEGRTFRIEGLPDTYTLDGITTLRSAAGDVANLAVGNTFQATAQATLDATGKQQVNLTYTAEAPAASTYAVTGPAFDGPTYLPLLPIRVGASQPVAYTDPVTMSINGGAPFPFDEAYFGGGSVSGGGAWYYDNASNGQTAGPGGAPNDDGLKRTIFFPAGTAWDGTPVAATQIDLAPVTLSPQATADFSLPADGAAPFVALRGNAKVTADSLCEKGTCVVIEETADSASTLCKDSEVGSVAGFWPQSQNGKNMVVRMRVLGQDAKDSELVSFGRPGLILQPGQLKAASGITGFTYDSGWMDFNVEGPLTEAVAAYVFDCAPGVRIMFQSFASAP